MIAGPFGHRIAPQSRRGVKVKASLNHADICFIMNTSPMTTSSSQTANPEDRRQHRRIQNRKRLSTPLGEVVDFSAGGFQIFRKGKAILQIDQTVELSLEYSGESIDVTARVAWIKPMGFRRRAIGFAFDAISDEDQQRLHRIVSEGHDECTGPAAYLHG